VTYFRIPTGLTNGGRAAAFLALAAAALAALSVGAGSAAAASPCWKLVLNDWFVDGRIDGTYPLKCYTQAQQHVNEDAKQYSTVQQDIQRALLAAVRRDKAQKSHTSTTTTTSTSGGSNSSGGGTPPSGGSNPPSNPSGGTTTTASSNHKGFITRVINDIGPSNAESVPTPLLVLAGIAILLLAAAAASWFARRYHARRLRPAPAPESTPPDRP
jgi:hypothetical protein